MSAVPPSQSGDALAEQTPSTVGSVLLEFLKSVGQRSEAEMYLRLFRSLPRGRFACVVPSRAVLEENLGTLAEQLGFLRDLGLYPSVVLSASESRDVTLSADLVDTLTDLGLEVATIPVDHPDVLEQAELALAEDRLPLFSVTRPGVEVLAALCHRLQPRKVVVLRPEGGLGPQGGSPLELEPAHQLETRPSGIAFINLRSDYHALCRGTWLSADERSWLDDVRTVLERVAAGGTTRTTVSFAAPWALLRELFTVRGEGTLVKLGAPVTTPAWEDVDRARLSRLIETAFGRQLVDAFWQRSFNHVVLERDFRGVALLESTDLGGAEHAAFLTKFAVQPVARGEGLGQDLWRAVTKEVPRLYWRARPENPINSWYTTVCDGMSRSAQWTVYWRGIQASAIPAVIADAHGRPIDFVDEKPASSGAPQLPARDPPPSD